MPSLLVTGAVSSRLIPLVSGCPEILWGRVARRAWGPDGLVFGRPSNFAHCTQRCTTTGAPAQYCFRMRVRLGPLLGRSAGYKDCVPRSPLPWRAARSISLKSPPPLLLGLQGLGRKCPVGVNLFRTPQSPLQRIRSPRRFPVGLCG